jgi:ankyrin repeat protein
MIAVMEVHVSMVKALLARPAVVASAGIVNNNGWTALMIAEQRGGHARMVQLLGTCNE